MRNTFVFIGNVLVFTKSNPALISFVAFSP